jgi:hypothetical protein
MDNISESETIISSNDLSPYLFGLQHEFEIKYKNDDMKEEVNFLLSHRYIDKKSLFNYIFIYQYYENLINNPIIYQINVVLNDDQIKENLMKVIGVDLDLSNIENKIIIEINCIIFNEQTGICKFDLFEINEENGDKRQILGDVNKKEIEEKLKENKNIIYFIKIKFEEENASVPICQFNIYKSNKINIEKNKEKYLNLKEKANEKFKSHISNIYNEFFNKKELDLDSYFTRYIYNRKTILQNTINLLITSEINDLDIQILSSFNQESKKILSDNTTYKEIILKNYIIFQKKVNQNLNNKIKDYDILPFEIGISQTIYKKILKHFKSEIKFFKNSLNHYNSLINDSISLSTESNLIISEPEMITYHKDSINNLIQSEIEEYNSKILNLYNKFKSNKKTLIDDEEEKILQRINSIYFTTNSDFKTLIDSYTSILLSLKKSSEQFFQNLQLSNQELFSNLNKILQETGIHSQNFNSFLSKLNTNSLNIENNIQNLIDSKTTEYNKLAVQLGISGTLGLATSGLVFTASRAATAIGSDALAGSLGGPVGTVAGIFIGTFTFLGQTYYSFKKNKDDILKLEVDLRNATNVCYEVFKDNAKDGFEENKFIFEKDLKEVKRFIDILVKRAIMSKSSF